jgi:hypothetical protein
MQYLAFAFWGSAIAGRTIVETGDRRIVPYGLADRWLHMTLFGPTGSMDAKMKRCFYLQWSIL